MTVKSNDLHISISIDLVCKRVLTFHTVVHFFVLSAARVYEQQSQKQKQREIGKVKQNKTETTVEK